MPGEEDHHGHQEGHCHCPRYTRCFWARLFPGFRVKCRLAAVSLAQAFGCTRAYNSCLVTARPAVPMCWTEGHMSKGNDVVLKCFANGGSQPLSYKWAKISGHSHPYRAGAYHSQHSFHSELSYQESFHSTINQGEGAQPRESEKQLWDWDFQVVPSQTWYPGERLLI